MKSGFIRGETNPTLDKFVAATKTIGNKLEKNDTVQGAFADNSFGSTKSRRFSAGLVEGDDNEFWFAQVQLLFQRTIEAGKRHLKEYSFVQDFDKSTPIDELDRILSVVYLRWPTTDEKDHEVNFKPSSSESIDR